MHLDPDESDCYINRGIAYSEIGQYRRAIQDFSKAIRLGPGSFYSEVAFAYINRGISYQGLGQNHSAIKDYDLAIRIKPNEAKAYYNRGRLYQTGTTSRIVRTVQRLTGYNRSHHEKAVQDFDKAIQIDCNYELAYVGRGLSYIELGENQKAINDYTKAIEFGSDNSLTYRSRADVYRSLGQTANADADDYKAQSLEDNPRNHYPEAPARIHPL
jgi:tetratricopeptide (TPR) repeat protein